MQKAEDLGNIASIEEFAEVLASSLQKGKLVSKPPATRFCNIPNDRAQELDLTIRETEELPVAYMDLCLRSKEAKN